MLFRQIVHVFQYIAVDVAEAKAEKVIAQRPDIRRVYDAMQMVQSDKKVTLARYPVVKFDLGTV